jgi:hypothetical protein
MESKPTRADKRKLREQERKHLEQDWLAPAGSVQEKKLLTRWKKHGKVSGTVSEEDLQLIDKWLREPEGIRNGRGILLVHAAKKKFLGEVIFETANERHKQLNDEEWLVAYFTAHGMKQSDIAGRLRLKRRRVVEIMKDIKDRITMEFNCELESVKPPQITSWFFGL